MTFTISSMSSSSEQLTIKHTLKVFCAQAPDTIFNRLEEVVIEEIIQESDSLPLPPPVWEWFIPPSDEFITATRLTRLQILNVCKDEIVRWSRRIR